MVAVKGVTDMQTPVTSEPRDVLSAPPGQEIPPPPPPPPTRRSRRVLWIGIAAAVLLVAGGLTAFFLTRGEDAGPDATQQPGAAEEAPAPPEGPAIELASGSIRVEEAETVETFPPGCDGAVDPSCQVAEPGYEILVVWFASDGADPAAASDEIIEVYGDVYVTDATGERTDAFGGGMMSERLMVVFTPEEGATGLTLHWPGTDPIPLDV